MASLNLKNSSTLSKKKEIKMVNESRYVWLNNIEKQSNKQRNKMEKKVLNNVHCSLSEHWTSMRKENQFSCFTIN